MSTRSGRGLRAALRHRDYRFLIAASAISQTGDWLYNVALLVWVYDATGSAGWVAVVTVARLVPYVVVGPFGGVLADTYDRRKVLIVSDVARAGLMFGLAAIATVDGPVALAAVLACITTATGTAYRPSVVAMLPDARVLGGYMLGTAFIYGVQTVVLVLVAKDQLGAGAGGVGILYAALGVGGVLGAAIVARLARAPRLGAVLYGSLLLASVPMALLAVTASGGPAFTLVMVSSVGAVVLDVLALTQL